MRRVISLAILLAVLAPLLLTTACAANPSHEVQMASAASLPHKMQNAPARVRQAYQFAVANPDATQNVPCYCGCGAMGHTSNYACYVKASKADGTLIYDEHALGCSLCVDITLDVMRMTADGRAPPEIRASILATYAKFGPPNQPVP